MSVLFSIIIPTLNEELFLPKLLADMKKQVEKSFEVIVVDGHSIDNTVSIAKPFEDSFSIRTVFSKRRNVSYQKNKGAHHSKGKYLIFLDADVRIGTTFLSNIRRSVEKKRSVLLIPAFTPQSRTYHDKLMFSLVNSLTELSQNFSKPFPTPGSVIFEKNFFIHLGGYKENNVQDKKLFFPEDHEILLRAKKSGVQASFLKKAPIRFSMRRMETEGRVETTLKYLLSSIQITLDTNMSRGLFSYEMGGQIHKDKSEAVKTSPRSLIKKYSKQLKNLLGESGR